MTANEHDITQALARVAAVAIDDATKARPRHDLHNLSKKRLADVHETPEANP